MAMTFGNLALTVVAALATTAPALPLPAEDTTSAAGAKAEAHQLDLESFDQVWQTVRDTHWDPTLGGLDWEALRTELRPRVERATNRAEARAVVNELIGRLGQSHFVLIPANLYQDLGRVGQTDDGPGGQPGGGVAGFDLRVLDGQAVVGSVRAGIPAAKLGVRPGWVVQSVEGEAFAPLIARLAADQQGRTGGELLLTSALQMRLDGRVGQSTPMVLLDGADREVGLDLELVVEKGVTVHVGYLPAMSVWMETRQVETGVGVIAFNAFLDPGRLMPRFAAAVQSFLDAPGVVLDLRGNPGGIGGMAMGMAGWFLDRPGQRLGTMLTRDANLAFVVYPRPRTYRGPLAVLVDGLTASTAEILAGGLKDLGRARVFGSRTAGMALPSRIDRLPNGDGFQHAIASYVSAGGTTLEGNGVTPDIEVRLDRASLLAGHDPALAAALAWIGAEGPQTSQNR